MVASKNDEIKRIIFRPQKWLKEDLKSFMNTHRIKSKTEGIHKYIESLKIEVEKVKLQNSNGKTSQTSNGQISEKPCGMMVYIEKKAMCGDPQAPISAFMKSHLNVQVCALCQKLKNKELQEVKEKDQQEVKRFHEKTRKSVHNLQKRVKETIEQEETYCQHIGARVLVKKCEGYCRKHHPYRYQACQELKAEKTEVRIS